MYVFQCQNMSQDSYLGDTAAQSEDLDVTDTGVNGKVCAWLQQAQDPDSCTQGILVPGLACFFCVFETYNK